MHFAYEKLFISPIPFCHMYSKAMQKISCTIQFITPAFLGDANQNGAWRTPPFKAELRHWWRVVMARRNPELDWQGIREQEGQLFGNAWKDQETRQSRVLLRLSHWRTGKLAEAPVTGKIQNGKASVDGALYLGFGKIADDKATKGNKLEKPPAIDASEQAELRIGIRPGADDKAAQAIPQALALMSRYGAVGGRNRNGWGSFMLESDELPTVDEQAVLLDWRQALANEWAQGIGQDEQGHPLIWQTGQHSGWKKIMRELAQLRSDLNHNFGTPEQRSLLSYPVTKKALRNWDKQTRLSNSLRLKVMAKGDQFYGLVFHMPCQPKDDLWRQHPLFQEADGLSRLWQAVHKELDNRNELERVKA